ncbi:MAG TPA: putative nucleotide-diphospho-sugar transferase [Tepidisphaeraceae bacterium]|nr:putative nucleotide-diphospho-sugar transferase [Tepidisphaeraceae bacterium]
MARYVYVLVTGEVNLYPTLCYLSALSLRGVDPAARITLLTDEPTAAALHAASHRLLPLVDDVVAISDAGSPKLISRVLKTTMLQRVREPFIFLDVDTLAVRPIADRFARPESLQMALDRFPEAPEPVFPQWVKPLYETMGWRCPTPRYFNSGVMFVKADAAAERVFDEWHRRWRAYAEKTGRQNDQPALNSAIDATGTAVGVLPVAYNAMVQVKENFRRGARLLHFFADRYGADEGTEYQKLIQRAQAGDALSFADIQQSMSRRWPLVEPWSVRRHLVAGSFAGAWRTWRSGEARKHAARAKSEATKRPIRSAPDAPEPSPAGFD